MSITLDSRGKEVDIVTRKGADHLYRLNFKTADLTGYTVHAKIYDGEVIHDLVPDVDGSIVTIAIGHDVTAILSTSARHSVTLISPSGIVTPITYGPIYVNQAVPV